MAFPRHVLTILAVTDLERSLAFYRQAFGWPPAVDTPVYAELELPQSMRLGLYLREGFARNVGQTPAVVPAGSISATELYFHVDDVRRAMDRLTAAGARLLADLAPRAWGDEAAYFADPDGNVLVLGRPLPPPG